MAGTRKGVQFIPATLRRCFRWRKFLQRQVCLRAGTLGKDPQSVAMVDVECRLALLALQSHGDISHRNHIEQWCAASYSAS